MPYTNYSILVAEDDLDDKLLIQDAFEENGLGSMPIEYVENGDELLQVLNKNMQLPVLIFMDLNMPKKDGREALKEIKSSPRLKHIPVIVFTTSNSEDDIRMSYLHGVNTYFTKPALFSELVETVGIIKKYWLEKAALSKIKL